MKHRVEYIDIAKGIGIVLVIIGHVVWGNGYPMQGADSISNFIYSFHMPLFFIISGLCIKEAKKINKDTAIKMVKAYLVPYVVWSALYLLAFQLIAVVLKAPSVFSLDNFRFVHAISDCGLAPLWFLLALFISEIIVIAIKPALKKKWGVLLLIILAVISIVCSYWYETIDKINLLARDWLMGTLRIAPTTFYVMFGYMSKSFFEKCASLRKARWSAAAIILTVQILLCWIWNDNIDVQVFRLGIPWLYFVKGINGTLLIILLAQVLHTKWLLSLGKKTKELMILHYPPFYYTRVLGFLLGTIFDPNILGLIIISVVTILCCLIIDCILSRIGIWYLIMGKRVSN